MSVDTSSRDQQRHYNLYKRDFTAGCYVTMAPKGDLIKIMERVGKKVLGPEKNPFRMDDTPCERECGIYRDLVVA